MEMLCSDRGVRLVKSVHLIVGYLRQPGTQARIGFRDYFLSCFPFFHSSYSFDVPAPILKYSLRLLKLLSTWLMHDLIWTTCLCPFSCCNNSAYSYSSLGYCAFAISTVSPFKYVVRSTSNVTSRQQADWQHRLVPCG